MYEDKMQLTISLPFLFYKILTNEMAALGKRGVQASLGDVLSDFLQSGFEARGLIEPEREPAQPEPARPRKVKDASEGSNAYVYPEPTPRPAPKPQKQGPRPKLPTSGLATPPREAAKVQSLCRAADKHRAMTLNPATGERSSTAEGVKDGND